MFDQLLEGCEQFRAQGVDTFLYAGADALETLSKLHAELEVAR